MTESIDVGKTIGGDLVFIGVPDQRYDRAKTPLTGQVRHIISITDDEIEWLIAALAKEVGATRTRAIADSLKDMFCLNCDGTEFDPDTLNGVCYDCSE